MMAAALLMETVRAVRPVQDRYALGAFSVAN